MNERTSAILILLLLCATLTTWFFSAVELRTLEEELSRLEAERNQLRIQYFRELEERELIYREMRNRRRDNLHRHGGDGWPDGCR